MRSSSSIGGCSLVYLVDEVTTLLRFDTDRGGIDYRVAPAGTDKEARLDWVLPNDVINFLAGNSPLFTGFHGVGTARRRQ